MTYWRSALLIVCVGTSFVYSSSESQSGSSYEILLTFVGIELQSLPLTLLILCVGMSFVCSCIEEILEYICCTMSVIQQ